MKKRSILTILLLLVFGALLFAGPVTVHVAEDLPHNETGWVSARHIPNWWGPSQAYNDPDIFYFDNLPSAYVYNTDAGIVDTENYTITGTAPSSPSGSHIYLHIDKSIKPDPGIPSQH